MEEKVNNKTLKNKLITVALVVCFCGGLVLLLYPTIGDYWNQLHSAKVISDYTAQLQSMEHVDYEKLLQEAEAYNLSLLGRENQYELPENRIEDYDNQLNLTGDGIMGYVEIPRINCKLAIYHGTDEDALVTGVGHVEWSSLPVGGLGTHSVISGHRGIPTAKLFTDIDKLVEKDTFILHVLGKTLTYEVDQILVVLPEEISALQIEEDKDLCTLLTCTPYGVNTHRLLVRGHRIPNSSGDLRLISEAIPIPPTTVAPIVAMPILAACFGMMFFLSRREQLHAEALLYIRKKSGLFR